MAVEYWAPWTPKIGQRVRVRISGECRCERTLAVGGHDRTGHHPEEDGQLGTVYGWNEAFAYVGLDGRGYTPGSSHPFMVKFDHPFIVRYPGDKGRRRLLFSAYAAAELEPVDD